MNKITSIKIKYADGSYSGQIPISVLAKNISWDDDGHDITDAIGDVDINATGSLQAQINKKINTTDLSDYVNGQLAGDIADWLNANVNPVGSAVIVDKTLSIQGAAADAKIVKEIFSTKEEVNELTSALAGEIKWQVPQGALSVFPVTISGNKIIVNGTIETHILCVIIYGSKLLYTKKAPSYSNYKNIYFEPISSFTPGNIIKADINLVSGTYTASSTPYLDMRTINSNATSLYVHGNGVEEIIKEQPEMIAFGLYEGEYNNAVFEFSVVDITKVENAPAMESILGKIKTQINQLDQTLLNNTENIIFNIKSEKPRTISYSTPNLQGSLEVFLHHNLFFVNGDMEGLGDHYNSLIFFLISPSETNTAAIPTYTTSSPNLKNFTRAYDGIALDGFKLGHKYLIGLELVSGTYTRQSTDISELSASDLIIQLMDFNGQRLFLTPNTVSNNNSTKFYGEWVCSALPDCALLGIRPGTYENAIFKIIIKDLTLAASNIPMKIKETGLINISDTGKWLQGTYSSTGSYDGYAASSISDKRIHWAGSLPKKTKYIQFEDPYQVALFGWDSEYSSLKWLVSWQINSYFYKLNINNNTQSYYIDLEEVRNYFSNVEYISLGVRKKDESIIDQTHGPNIKIYVEPDTVPFIDQYILTEEDFSIGYFSPTYKKNIYNTNTSRNYLTTGKFKVYAGDEIEGILDPESNLGFFVLFLESDLQENNGIIRSNSGYKYNNNFKCYCYEDGYCEISVLGDGTPLFPNLLGNNQIIIHRNKNNNFEKMNLLIQSRFYYERENKANGSFVNPQPLTLIHFSDNHGSLITLDKIQELLENQDYVKNVTTGSDYRKMFIIDDVLNTGDAVYTYYGYSVDGQTITDFYDESVSYVVNDYIVYNSILYQCITNTTGPFNTEHWSEISTTLQNQRLLSRKQYLDHQMGKKSLFVLGNHDTQLGDYNTNTQQTTTTNMWHALKREDAYNTFFAEQKDQWGVTQTLNRCYWYKDYQQAKIRLIGIDMAYWDAEEFSWLSNLLNQARTNGYSVVLASHSQLSKATGNQNVTFQDLATNVNSPGKYRNSGNWSYGTYPDFWENTSGTVNNKADNTEIMTLLQDYSDIIICHLHGHYHADMFEYYDLAPDILAIGVDQGGALRAVHSAERTQSLPNWYVFNVITFDTYNKLIKIVRFGNDIDHYLRSKKVLTYDYANKRVITNY